MTAQADLMARLAGLVESTKTIKAAVHSGAWQRMADYADGPGTVRFDGMSGLGTGVSDPTARAALDRVRSIANTHQGDLVKLLAEAETALGRAAALVGLYPVRDTGELLTLAKGEPGCENCARIAGPRGPRRWEPIKPTLTNRTTVGGRLPKALYLCQWCYLRVLVWDRVPTEDELEMHHAGRRVPWPADVPQPKATA